MTLKNKITQQLEKIKKFWSGDFHHLRSSIKEVKLSDPNRSAVEVLANPPHLYSSIPSNPAQEVSEDSHTGCAQCGAVMTISTGPGRLRRYRGEEGYEVPAELTFMVCKNCGAEWMYADQIDILSDAFEMQRSQKRNKIMDEFFANLPASDITDEEIANEEIANAQFDEEDFAALSDYINNGDLS